MTTPHRVCNYVFVLLGVLGLVLKRYYSGPFRGAVLSHGGNVTATFACYFILRGIDVPRLVSWAPAAAITLLVSVLFEATDGFLVMANVYDPLDYAADALAVALAIGVDLLTVHLLRRLKPSE
jgi:hypothetical protein